jgi:hypothetical protein
MKVLKVRMIGWGFLSLKMCDLGEEKAFFAERNGFGEPLSGFMPLWDISPGFNEIGRFDNLASAQK